MDGTAVMAGEIEALLQALGQPGEGAGALAGGLPEPTPDARTSRTQALGPVLETARSLWYDQDPELDRVAEKMADASRDSEFFIWHPRLVSRRLEGRLPSCSNMAVVDGPWLLRVHRAESSGS